MEVEKYIKEKRQNLSKSSVKTYSSILRTLYKNVFESDDFDFDKFDKESEKVLKYLKVMLDPSQRKTSLAALVVITDNKDYRKQMLDDIKEYNKIQAKQVKSESQEENWVSSKEIADKHNELMKTAKILVKKDNLSISDLQAIQNYIILCVIGGIYIPPRRSKDFVDFKIKNINKETDNYIDKKKMVFNSYKTAKNYGRQEIDIPPTLMTILKKWIKLNPTDYLFFDSSMKPLTNVKLNQRLNKIFGKKASVNQIRHTYLSDKYGDSIQLKKDMEDDMKKMGTSTLQENIYIKK